RSCTASLSQHEISVTSNAFPGCGSAAGDKTERQNHGAVSCRRMSSQIRALTVADIMSTQVLTVGPSATIADAAGLMMQRRVGSVLIVDGSRLIGIITERDLVRFAASAADPATTDVAAFMTPDPDTTEP